VVELNQSRRSGGHIRVPVVCEVNREDRAGEFGCPVEEVALVLVDTWNGGDPKEGEAPRSHLLSTQMLLNRCRENGVTIIHAPNHPVVDRYPQYREISEEVRAFVEGQSSSDGTPPHLSWPPLDNDVLASALEIRKTGQGSQSKRDISRLLTPLESEYVLASHDEFRYVLWKRGVKLLLYAGGALNECMQHRDTGINLLIGSDGPRTGFTVVVLEDCSTATTSPRLNSQEMAIAMLEYFKRKIAFVGRSDEITFDHE
jgi:nicotinamidase-related amidase